MSMWLLVSVETISSLIERFLADPRLTVQVEDSARVRQLEEEVERLRKERDNLFRLYTMECDKSMAAYDLLRQHHIKWR